MAERRERFRRDRNRFDEGKIATRLEKFYTDDTSARTQDIAARIQRYAKYRQWTEQKRDPWEDASNVALPDLVTNSLRIQDTLHNAVMSIRPPISSEATKRADRDKQETIDQLLDYQFFIEQMGEEIVGELAEDFVNDGVFTAFIPWIREDRTSSDIKIFPPLPAEGPPGRHFHGIIDRVLPETAVIPIMEGDGWDWKVVFRDGTEGSIHFYTNPRTREIEMVIKRTVRVYDGPRVIAKDYSEVLFPARAANLQRPSPSNPKGASHVILVDHPTLDELRRLRRDGFYDLLTAEDLGESERTIPQPAPVQAVPRQGSDEDIERQKDDFQGITQDAAAADDLHRSFTRLVVFDVYDIDGDGIGEDVIWWFLLEKKKVMKVKLVSEMYPAYPPRRPFAEAQFLPVKGRRTGIGFLELQEAMHDTMKQILDQAMDSGTLANSPFFFYRATGSMKPEVIKLWPGEGYPVGDPANDVNFPVIPNPSQAFAINMLTLMQQWVERLSMITDLSFGRIPAGKSSALRTSGGIQSVLGQSDARPERILRRFFIGLSQVWASMHSLNQHFLPKDKQFRMTGVPEEGKDPYIEVSDRQMIQGNFRFTFRANMFNTNKAVMQEALFAMIGTFVSELGVQAGATTPETIWRLFRDWGKAMGHDPDLKGYLQRPHPEVAKQRITAEEAISVMLDEQIPSGIPLEPLQEHLEKLFQFQQTDQFGFLSPNGIKIFEGWATEVAERFRVQQQQGAIGQAAQGVGGQPGGQGQFVLGGNPQVQENELIDESLPTAQGRLQ